MTIVAVLLGVGCSVGIFLLFLGFDRPRGNATEDLETRLRGYGEGGPLTLDQMELQVPFKERVLDPLTDRVQRLIASRTPDSARQAIQAKLVLAGQRNLSASTFMTYRYLGLVALFAVGVLIGVLAGNPVMLAAGGLVGAGLGFYAPLLWLNQATGKRRREIQLALADAMDLLTIAVEAGLGFDAAVARLTAKFKNALTDEFAQVLQETKLGRPRIEALEDMGARCGVEDLHNFVQAIVQSEQMGVGIAKILRLQSEEIRRKRRQRAQEQAAQASLKMLLPMVGCIFPVLWIVLLGPAVILVMTRH